MASSRNGCYLRCQILVMFRKSAFVVVLMAWTALAPQLESYAETPSGRATQVSSVGHPSEQQPARRSWPELHWTFTADNDLFVGRGDDRGYTGGLTTTLTGARLADIRAPSRLMLESIDRWLGFDRLSNVSESDRQTHFAMQFGVLALTPERLDVVAPVGGDRPYASLIYISESRYFLVSDENVLLQSSLTLGLLGTSVAEQMQTRVHRTLGLRMPMGYGRQVSEGGELTARYSLSRHGLLRSLRSQRRGRDLKFVVEGTVGFITEASAALVLRWGSLASPWWADASDLGEYAAQPAPNGVPRARSRGDFYVTVGTKVRVRAYNALLQGQFRSSVHTLDSSELRMLVADSWIGVVRDVGQFQISYTIRHQSPEIRRGIGSRDQLWASLAIGRDLP